MCYNPITIKTPQGYRTVPCGKCMECLRKYQSDWSNRMYEELKAHNGKAVFFTLTYDEKNVPKNYLYYANETEFEIFRSPSDYGYDNTYRDEKGQDRVLPQCRGERKHKRLAPDMGLQSLGLDVQRIVDFNVTRKDRMKFRDQIQKLYGDYVRTLRPTDSGLAVRVQSDSRDVVLADVADYFENYEGDLFGDSDDIRQDKAECAAEEEIMSDLFTQVWEDEVSDSDVEEVPSEEVRPSTIVDSPFRERPIMMFNSVRKKDVQDWIKRARQRRARKAKKTGMPEQKFTFFVTSEYGPRTLRPHYHGVIFGLTAQESMDMAKDWQRHHGQRIQWDNVDLSKGDMSYCAKYCSKGSFEHPLCAKDFFYMKKIEADDVTVKPFTEYHSKHYERCIEIFGVDAPIVDPTFHLVSKGLGIKWVEDNKHLVDDFNDIDFAYNTDVPQRLKIVTVHKVDTENKVISFTWEDLEKKDWPTSFRGDLFDSEIKYDLGITKNLGEQDERQVTPVRQNFEKNYDECIRKLFDKFHYYRVFKGQVVPYGVPKYYRAKILNDGLRSAFANFVQQVNVELYQEKFNALRAADPSREDAEIVSALERQEIEEKFNRILNCRKKLEKIYSTSKL